MHPHHSPFFGDITSVSIGDLQRILDQRKPADPLHERESWLQVEMIFDRPESRTIARDILDAYVSAMTERHHWTSNGKYSWRLQILDDALRAQSAARAETAPRFASPECAV